MDRYETIQLDVDDEHGVATLVLDRPGAYNAISHAMHCELAHALGLVATRRSVRALVLRGNGRGFCAGQDVTEFGSVADPTFRADDHVRRTYNRLVLGIRGLDVPVIAAVHGVAAGAGWGLALAADLRIASTDASFRMAFVDVGLVPDTGGTKLLAELIGPSRTLELAYSGDAVGADQALGWGLVNRLAEPDDLVGAATAWARSLAGQPTRALALTKHAVHAAASMRLADALEAEAQLQQVAIRTSDHVEGVTAFIERRSPTFAGR